MSVENGKRITFKRTRPNPLFYEWLEDLYEEAKQKGSRLEPMLQEALSSISKYPLPLQSGAECAILKGFDKRLCSFLDRRLDVYTNSCKQSSIGLCVNSISISRNDNENYLLPVVNTQSSSEHTDNTHSLNSSTNNNIHFPSTSKSLSDEIRKKKKFKPIFRSGSYAFLMVLGDLKVNETICKDLLMAKAQMYCEADISTQWKNMTRLINLGLVNKSVTNNKPEFNLTEEGILTAKELCHTQDNKVFDGLITKENSSSINFHTKTIDEEFTISKPLLNNCNTNKSEVNDVLYNGNICSEISVINSIESKLISNKLLNEDKCATGVNNLIGDKNNGTEVKVIHNSKAKILTDGLLNHDTSPSEVNDLPNSEIKYINKVIVTNDCDYKSDYAGTDNVEPNRILNIDYVDYIEMEPGSFDIILLIDKHETSGLTNKNDPTVTQFNKYPKLKHEYRSLKVGDFTWIARHRINTNQELVLPYVVERKRMDDLGNSIKDGRFHEQKFRLRKCGLNHVIYMVENHGSNKHVGLPMQSLMQALANTRVQDSFKVHVTESLAHSVRFLTMMTLRLVYEYKDKRLKGHSGEPRGDVLMTFEHFNKSSVKNRALSVTDTFIKLLLQIKGVSVEKAIAITNIYRTPRMLIEKYKNCDQKEGEMLLANLKFGELDRSVGPSVSIAVYQLFTFRNNM